MTHALTPALISQTNQRIHPCAVDPAQFPETLCGVRDETVLAKAALLHDHRPSATKAPCTWHEELDIRTPWAAEGIQRLPALSANIPGYSRLRAAPMDSPTRQLRVIPVEKRLESAFAKGWTVPGGLFGVVLTPVIRRKESASVIIAPTRLKPGRATDTDVAAFRLRSPQICRALSIGGTLDEGRFKLALHRVLLDQLSIGVFMVDTDGHVLLRNAAAEAMLQAHAVLTQVSGRLCPVSMPHAVPFIAAINRAASPDTDLGSRVSGIALPGPEGQNAVSYVLPLGRSERCRALGPGHAAVCVSARNCTEPPAAEVLSALTGLTMTEARIALGITGGQSTDDLAAAQGISINILRKHLPNTDEKTGPSSQTVLAARVNGLRQPVRINETTARGNFCRGAFPKPTSFE